jgi:hypothetical protein
MRALQGLILIALSASGTFVAGSHLSPGRLSQGRPTNLPQELEALGAELACEPVPGFFDRPGMIEPPYLYGYVPGWKGDSAVFWCFRPEDEAYLFVAMREGRIRSHFVWRGGFPGGLSLDVVERRSLSSFVYVDDWMTSGPAGVYTAYKPVVSYYDGEVDIFYEHEGRWLVRRLD